VCGSVALQAVFDISNDNDAEVCLQITNALTLALLSYRTKMITLLVYTLYCLCVHMSTVLSLFALMLFYYDMQHMSANCKIYPKNLPQ